MFTEDDLLPISALQHLLFCERQCAFIHIERQWEENRFTPKATSCTSGSIRAVVNQGEMFGPPSACP
jgi:hypothetical protein